MSAKVGLEAIFEIGPFLKNVATYKAAQDDLAKKAERLAYINEKVATSTGAAKEAWQTMQRVHSEGFDRSLEDLTNMNRLLEDQAAALPTVAEMASAASKSVLKASAAVTGFFTTLVALGNQGAKVRQVSDAFADLGGNIEALREGSAGTLADVDLMRKYNTAVTEVGKGLGEKLPEAMVYLRKIAAATGKDFSSMIDSLTSGVSNLSQEQLANIGINVDLAGAFNAAAEASGRNVKELSRAEKQSIALDLAMRGLMARGRELPSVPDEAATAFQRWQAAIKNAKDELAVSLIPVLTEALPPLAEMTDTLKTLFESDEFKDGVRDLAEGLGNVLESLVEMDPAARNATAAIAGIVVFLPRLIQIASILKTIVGAAAGVAGGVPLAGVVAAASMRGSGSTEQFAMEARNEEIEKARKEMEKLRQETELGVGSYADYRAAMVSAMGEYPILTQLIKDVTEASGEEAATRTLVEMGLIESQEAWQMEAMILSTLPEKIEYLARMYGELGIAREDALSNADALSAFRDREMSTFRELAEARETFGMMAQEALIRANGNIQAAQIEHENAMAQIVADGETARAEADFNYKLSLLQAEQNYQSRRAGLVNAGRLEEAAQLDADYQYKIEVMEAEHGTQLQLLNRKNMMAQIEQQRAYIEELNTMRDQALQRLAMEIASWETTTAVQRQAQQNILTIIGKGGSEQLWAVVETEKAILKVRAESGKEQAKNAIIAVEAIIAAYELQIDAAKGILDGMETDLSGFELALPSMIPELPPMTFPPIEPPKVKEVKVPKIAKEATKPAIEELDSLLSRITNMIKTTAEGLAALASFRVPKSAKLGLARLSEWMVYVVTELDETYDQMVRAIKDNRKQPERLRTMSEMSEYIENVIGVIKPTVDAIAVLREELVIPKDMKRRTRDFSATLSDIVLELANTWLNWKIFNKAEYLKGTDRLQFMSAISQDVNAIIGVIGPTVEALKTLRRDMRAPRDMDRRVDEFSAALEKIVVTLTTSMTDWKVFNEESYFEKTSDIQLASAVTEDINRIIGIIKPALGAVSALRDELLIPADLDARIDALSNALKRIVIKLTGLMLNWEIFKEADYQRGTSKVQLAAAVSGDVNDIMGAMMTSIDALERLAGYRSGNLEELMMIFGRDFLMTMDFLGALALASDSKVNDALLFRDNAHIIADAINDGMEALQALGGGMVNVDWGGTQAGVGLYGQPQMGMAYPGGDYASKVYNVNLSFPNLTITGADKATAEGFGEMVGQVVSDMLKTK